MLDLMLPGRSGFQVLRDIRARKPSLAVLILTAKDSLDERVAGLDAGADDYMAPAGSPPALEFTRHENQYRLSNVWTGDGWDRSVK